MKLQGHDDPFYKLNVLNEHMLEKKIEKLETTRSCPTGYFNSELKGTSTIELLHLRKTLFEYLSIKSQKTRNLEFIYLIKRINKELSNRGIKTPIGDIISFEKSNNCNLSQFDEVSEFLNTRQDEKFLGEYCYLARKRTQNLEEECFENLIITTHYFGINKMIPLSVIPDFIQDKNIKEDAKNFELTNQVVLLNTNPESTIKAEEELFSQSKDTNSGS